MRNGDGVDRLTEGEKVCLREWLRHKSAKEIARDLGITHHAVEKRLKMARTKLGVATSLQAARILQAVEEYGQAVAGPPDLPSTQESAQTNAPHTLFIGAIAMTAIAAALIIALLHPSQSEPAEAATNLVLRAYDEQLEGVLNTMIAAAEIGSDGEIFFKRAVGDPRYLKPGSGYYWQISAEGREDFKSRSLWDRQLRPPNEAPSTSSAYYTSNQFSGEPLRLADRSVRLPGSDIAWRFIVTRPIEAGD